MCHSHMHGRVHFVEALPAIGSPGAPAQGDKPRDASAGCTRLSPYDPDLIIPVNLNRLDNSYLSYTYIAGNLFVA